MKNISIWAARNPKKSRLLIITLQILQINLGFIIGIQLTEVGVLLHKNLLFIIIGIFLIISFIYPKKKELNKAFKFGKVFKRQKILDGIAGLCILSIAILGANLFINNSLSIQQNILIKSAHAVERNNSDIYDQNNEEIAESKNNADTILKDKFDNIVKKDKKIKKSKFISFHKKSKGSNSQRVLLIILTILVAIILLYPLALAVCTLSCSGYGFWAGVVAIGGVLGLIIGSVALIKRIIKKHPKGS